MSIKFILIIVFIYISLAFLGSTFEEYTTAAGNWAGNVEGEETLNPIYDIRDASVKSELMNISGSVPLPGTGFWSSVYKMVTLRFSFLIEDYEMVWFIVFLPISIAGMLSIALIGTRIWEAVMPFS